MKGETKVAPALAARTAWLTEKHRVTLVLMPLSLKKRQAFRPSQVIGSLTVTFGWILDRARPSLFMPSKSIAATSALIGPSTRAQISPITSWMLRPDWRIRVGLVVTPSTRPVSAHLVSSAMSAVSMKNFIALKAPYLWDGGGLPQTEPPCRIVRITPTMHPRYGR